MDGREFNPHEIVEKTRKLVLNDVYWDKHNRMLGGCSICLSVCGLATIVFAFVFFITIGSLIHSGVIQNAVVDSQVCDTNKTINTYFKVSRHQQF
jgi:hypothetical protein